MTGLRVHHLDCCSMCPRIGRVNEAGRFVGHVLAIETERSGVVLVDTGIGSMARAHPKRLLGRGFTTLFRPDVNPAGSALAQLQRLGLATDVRHIIVTHLDTDHAGGLSDFPNAVVHVHEDELRAARGPRGVNERQRYRSVLWQHQPNFAPFRAAGEPWFGFEAARQLAGVPDEIVVVPLPGHTRGHVAVAVQTSDQWLLHCGDGYFHRDAIRSGGVVPPANRRFERFVAIDRRRVETNHERLAELSAGHRDGVTVFCAHDPIEFDELSSSAPPS